MPQTKLPWTFRDLAEKSRLSKAPDFIWSQIKFPSGRNSQGWIDLRSTLNRITYDGKFPHKNDGSIFKNREGLLPKNHRDYYREFVHPTPGIDGPGPQRIIKGGSGELFYSPDHYQTFTQIR